MHELSLAEGLADLVEERTAGRTVVAVRVRVGADAAVLPDAMAYCWEAVTVGTPLAGSRLDLEVTAGDELVLAALELLREESHV